MKYFMIPESAIKSMFGNLAVPYPAMEIGSATEQPQYQQPAVAQPQYQQPPIAQPQYQHPPLPTGNEDLTLQIQRTIAAMSAQQPKEQTIEEIMGEFINPPQIQNNGGNQ